MILMRTDPFLDLEVVQQNDHRRAGPNPPANRKKHRRMNELIDNYAVVAAGLVSSEQPPQRGVERLKGTEEIGTCRQLQAVYLNSLTLEVLDHLPVIQITARDLLERAVDDEQQPHALRMDVGRPGGFGFPDLHLKLDDRFQRKTASVQSIHKCRVYVVGHVLHAHLAVFEELQIVD